MVRSALVAAVALIAAPYAFAQNVCDLSPVDAIQASCQSPINSGDSTQCSISITNSGVGDCVGDWKAALGAFDPGTVDSVHGSGVLGNCSLVGDFPFPFGPVQGHTALNSSWLCQGSGALHSHET